MLEARWRLALDNPSKSAEWLDAQPDVHVWERDGGGDGRSRRALANLRRAIRCRPRTLAKLYMEAADILCADAATAQDVRTAGRLYERGRSLVQHRL